MSEKGHFLELNVDGCSKIVDVARTDTEELVLCKSNSIVEIFRRPLGVEASWIRDPLPIEPTSEDGSLVATADFEAVILSKATYSRRRGGEWKRLEFEARGDGGGSAPPLAALVSGGSLWLGYNYGEFGGGLYRAEIQVDGSVTLPVLVRNLFVIAIAHADADSVWVAGGNSHGVFREATLIRYDDNDADVWIDQKTIAGKSSTFAKSRFRLPTASSVDAFAMSKEGHPLILVEKNGIFRITPEGVETVVSGEFTVEFPEADYTYVSTPTSMLMGEDSSILVGTTGLGVLRLTKGWLSVGVEQLSTRGEGARDH
jgi:hypothetical protein